MNEYEMELLATGTTVNFEILNSTVEACIGSSEAISIANIMLLDEDEDTGYNTVEWGAFGFIYTLANLSFMDAAPRGNSTIDYVEDAHIRLEDMMRCLKYTRGTINFYCDYLHGRLVKTDITVHQDGRVEIRTVCRGNALKGWLDQLLGKKKLQAV